MSQDLQQRGYDDQKAGALDPVLSTADTSDGYLYRNGARERRREEADGVVAANEGKTPVIPGEYRPDPTPAVVVEVFGTFPDMSLVPAGWADLKTAPLDGTPVTLLLPDGTNCPARFDGKWLGEILSPLVPTEVFPIAWKPVPGAKKPSKRPPPAPDLSQQELF